MTVADLALGWIASLVWLEVTLGAFGVGTAISSVGAVGLWKDMKVNILPIIPGIITVTILTLVAYVTASVAVILAWDNQDSADDTIYNLGLAFYIGQLIGSIIFAFMLTRRQIGWALFVGLLWLAAIGATAGFFWFIRELAFWFFLGYLGWIVIVMIMLVVVWVRYRRNPRLMDSGKKRDDVQSETEILIDMGGGGKKIAKSKKGQSPKFDF